MTLNEAIRTGCHLLVECRDGCIVAQKGGCVLGAAYVGLLGYVPHGNMLMCDVMPELGRAFPELYELVAIPTLSSARIHSLHSAISYLHYMEHWTREAIAEWADPHPELHEPMPTVNKLNKVCVNQQEGTA